MSVTNVTDALEYQDFINSKNGNTIQAIEDYD